MTGCVAWRDLPRILLLVVVPLLGLTPCLPASAAGPWQGRLVDKVTGQPIEGAVVVAIWWRRSPGPIHPGRALHDVVEVVSDASGRFTIPPVRTFTLVPFNWVQGADVRIFKSGYGRWDFQGRQGAARLRYQSDEQNPWILAAWKKFENEGVVLELPPIRDREERSVFLMEMQLSGDVPDDRIPHYRRALSDELEHLRRLR